MTNQTPDTSQDELGIEVHQLPEGARFIGPGDDIVISAEILRANYLPRKDVVEAIGKDEAFVDISEIDHTGKVTNIIKGNSYTPVMVGRNQLRAELRTKLGLDANGEGE